MKQILSFLLLACGVLQAQWIPGGQLPILNPQKIQFVSLTTGWVANSDTLCRTTNGGTDWQIIHTASIDDFYFTTSTNGWMMSNLYILHTIDGGIAWQIFNLPAATGAWQTSIKASEGKIFILSHYPQGNSWASDLLYGDPDNLLGWRRSSVDGLYTDLVTTSSRWFGLYGDSGKVRVSVDSAEHWSRSIIDPTASVTGLILKSNESYLSTANGFYASPDSGITWNLRYNFVGLAHSLQMTNNGHLYIILDSLIYSSVNAGATWQLIGAGDILGHYNNTLYSIYGGRVYMLNTTTTVNDETTIVQLPRTLELKQNYPNPFNPTTNLSFFLPQESFVELKVYNILGQIVVTLINEKKLAGEHQVVFDDTQFSSGFYTFRLRTDIGVKTKRMMLVK